VREPLTSLPQPHRRIVIVLHVLQLVAVAVWAVLLFGTDSDNGWRWVAFAAVFVLYGAIWAVKRHARR
jgi:hypothetical protein